jgi:hypothetical protein
MPFCAARTLAVGAIVGNVADLEPLGHVSSMLRMHIAHGGPDIGIGSPSTTK